MWQKITDNNICDATSTCQKTDFDKFKRFIEYYDIVSFRKDICFGTTIGRFFETGKSNGATYINISNIGGLQEIDHYMFYKTKSGKILFTTQPYIPENYIPRTKERLEMAFGDKFTVNVYGTEDSWYYPTQTALFVVELKD